jgi:hypothetical protein
MYSVHATKKLLDRMKEPVEAPVTEPTTILGNWYAKPLFWKPQYALFVNERTFLSVLVPLAPATTLLRRFPEVLAMTLEALAVPQSFIDAEITAMEVVNLSKTQSRQFVGVLNELAILADVARHDERLTNDVTAALELSRVPLGATGKSYRFPDQALEELVAEVTGISVESEMLTSPAERTDATIHDLFPG